MPKKSDLNEIMYLEIEKSRINREKSRIVLNKSLFLYVLFMIVGVVGFVSDYIDSTMLNALIIAGLFLSLSSKITTNVIVNATSGEIGPANLLLSPQGGMAWIVALVGMMPSIMIGLVYLIVGTAFAHFAFKLTGGTGGKMKTLSVVGYSMMPVILVRLVALLVVLFAFPAYGTVINFDPGSLAILTPEFLNWAYTSGIWFTIDIMTTGAFLWTGYLLIFGIREAHDTSTLWAALVAIACVIVLVWTFWQVH